MFIDLALIMFLTGLSSFDVYKHYIHVVRLLNLFQLGLGTLLV